MPYLLLQIVAVPLVASWAVFLIRPRKNRRPAWIAIGALCYTTLLLSLAGLQLHGGEILREQYAIGPLVSVNLLADGLSLPVALIINLICLALALYSIHYVEHRIELIYGNIDDKTYGIYYRRFFLLYLYFPTGFMGVAFATNTLAVYTNTEYPFAMNRRHKVLERAQIDCYIEGLRLVDLGLNFLKK